MHGYLFYDFDGVICDSRDECFLVSLHAYDRFLGRETRTHVALAYKHRFNLLRPYIRNTDDFLYLHHWLAADNTVGSQAQFDSCIPLFSDEERIRFGAEFYQERERLMAEEPEWWHALNPLYPGMRESLRPAAENPFVQILSSKKPPHIRAILSYNGINWPESRIHFPGYTPKIVYLRAFLEKHAANGGEDGPRAWFVDDQIDHFYTASDDNVKPMLASWGYVFDEWLSQDRFPVLSLADGLKLLNGGATGLDTPGDLWYFRQNP